jgi:H/ACA ribonucleoprotein complex subunit 4
MEQKPIKQLLEFSLINIDKPSGPTSFQVSQYLKHSLKLAKTSHLGTLDPQVSGVLPITLGRACRLSDVFMHKNKTYIGIMRLHKEITQEELKKAIKKFIGKINQLPPVRSRVKRQVREREVVSFDVLEINGKDVLFKTEVQAGTYIRKLCDDIGKELNIGAHMLELRRTQAGIFNEESIYTLYDLDNAITELNKGNEKPLRKMLIPAEEAIKQVLPILQTTQNSIKKLLTGKPLMKSDIETFLPKEETFALFNKEQFIGIYKKSNNEGDIIARALFVFN